MPDETCEGIRINDDDLQEPTENLFVTFVPDVPGARSVIATVNIRDNEPIVGMCINNEKALKCKPSALIFGRGCAKEFLR